MCSPLSQFYIPFIRTFDVKNGLKRETKRSVEVNVTTEEGTSLEMEEIIESVAEEKILSYLPNGNYKWYASSYTIILLSLIGPIGEQGVLRR